MVLFQYTSALVTS